MEDGSFFIDYLNDDSRGGFNDRDFYAERYPTLSFGRLTNKELRVGPIRDFSLIAGINVGGDSKVVKHLPGSAGLLGPAGISVSKYGT